MDVASTRKETIEPLLEQCLFGESSQPILLFDPATRFIVDANQAATRAIIRSGDALIGRRLDDVVAFDSPEAESDPSGKDPSQAIRVRVGNQRMDVTIRHARKGNDQVGIMFFQPEGGSPSWETDAWPPGDSSAELALRESEMRFRVIAEDCPAMVAILQHGKIRFVNNHVTKSLGYSPEEMLGKEFLDLVHPDDKEMVRERNNRRLQGEHVPDRYEFKLVTQSNEVCWIDFTASLFDYEGQPAVLGTAMDITERRSTEARLRQREMELAQVARLTTMGEMVAGIAHEINQPLSAISNFADACSAEVRKVNAPQTPKIQRWTEQIGQQAVRCGDIIRRLRSYVRQKKMDESDVSINDTIEESIALLRNEIQQSVVRIRRELDSPSPFVRGSAVELQQVLVNLLVNGHEAIKRNGQSDGELLVRSLASDGVVRIDVEDNGPGIDQNNVDRLYEAFFTTKPNGMGMGLAISRSIVERHGGRLWASRREPQGATFHIELPIGSGVKRVLIG